MSKRKSLKERIYVGEKDINGNKIYNNDLIHAQFVNYMGQENEYIDKEFNGKILYNNFKCKHMIADLEGMEIYYMNHRSMRIKKLQKTKSPESHHNK